tara:strand:- start:1876 stop:2886 length:1011 start_codon:yes stop_codon:yes gene_type:complete
MFEYYYHEILRRTIIGFGTLFNGIEIKHEDSDDNVASVIKVPLAYGPTQKFLARLQQSPDLNKPVQVTLPRMSFEFVGLQYDGSRKVTTTQTFKSETVGVATAIRKTFMPVPYNMSFELTVLTKLNDDMLQIVEQIVPYFQPAFNLSVDLVSTIGEKRDIPVVIENITMEDDYEGDFTTRRALIYTFRFTAKTYLFGPVGSRAEGSKDLIKKSTIGYIAGGSTKTPSRDITYSVVPRATKAYDANVTTTLGTDIAADTTVFDVADASGIAENTFVIIDSESMFVDKKSGNKLIVRRGEDGTTPTAHVTGAGINLITTTTNDLIEIGDDFGFDGSLI